MSSISRSERLRVELLSAIGAGLLRLLWSSYRYRFDRDRWLNAWRGTGSRPAIIIVWHDRQLVMPRAYWQTGRAAQFKSRLCALASRHRDGRIVARAFERLGMLTVAGSSTRGGAGAFLALSEQLKKGIDVAITPDGPRGPQYVLKEGAVKLAQKSGCPLVPLAMSARNRWSFRSWDRMFLPKPFSEVFFEVGDLIEVPAELSPDEFERTMARVEEALKSVTQRCDDHVVRS